MLVLVSFKSDETLTREGGGGVCGKLSVNSVACILHVSTHRLRAGVGRGSLPSIFLRVKEKYMVNKVL